MNGGLCWAADRRLDLYVQLLVLGLISVDFAFDMPHIIGKASTAHVTRTVDYYRTVIAAPAVNGVA